MARVYTHSLADFIENPIPLRDMDLRALDERTAIEFQIHNELSSGMFDYFVENTTLEMESLPSNISQLNFGRAAEIGVGMTLKVDAAPQRVGYPLDGYSADVGWTTAFFDRASTDEMARTIAAIEEADVRGLRALVSMAIYTKANADNYISPFNINRIVQTPIDVKRFWNGDAQNPPRAWNGATFAAPHDHYLAANGATGAALVTALDSTIYTVEEHSQNNKTIIIVNNLDASKIKGLSKFIEALPASIIESSNVRRINLALDLSQTDDRILGQYDGRVVMVKPWALPGYVVVLNVNGDKPLKMREPLGAAERGLRVLSENVLFRLQAKSWMRQVGFGTFNRSGGAVLDLNNVSYTTPTVNP